MATSDELVSRTTEVQIRGRSYTLVSKIKHVVKDSAIYLIADNDGNRAFLTESEWEELGKKALSGIQLVSSRSTTAEKLKLFKSLFSGRYDVYGKGYLNRKSGKISYTFACKNEWKRPVCQKPNIKCGNCKRRDYLPLSDSVLLAHFREKRTDFKNVIGMYPIIDSDKTSFLVIDFDGAGHKEEALALLKASTELDIDVSLERSRSGNGIHAWLFFEEAILASTARKFGSLLITLAMQQGNFKRFEAYDRMFPAQDSVEDGGLGNMIALPFQGLAMSEGNSMFVDENFQVYDDQWAFLSGVKRVSKEAIETILAGFSTNELGNLIDTDMLATPAFGPETPSDRLLCNAGDLQTTSGTHVTDRQSDRQSMQLPGTCATRTINVLIRNRIFIEKEGLRPKELDAIRRLAAFANPEYYKAQAMHQSTYKKPRIVYLGYEDDSHLGLPRGCLASLIKLAKSLSIHLLITDGTTSEPPIDVDFAGELRTEQIPAAQALMEHDMGVLSAPTGFGKTVIGSYLIGQRKLRSLVLVNTSSLLLQWQRDLEHFLDVREELPELRTKTGRKSRKKRSTIGRIGAGSNSPNGIIDVATYQSLFEDGDVAGEIRVKEFVSSYGLVICDECQHVPAPRFGMVTNQITAKFIYGLSATPIRDDGLDPAIFMYCGPLAYKISPKEQALRQGFERYLIPRFLNTRIEHSEPGLTFNQILSQICENDTRNNLITKDIIKSLEEGKKVIVLTRLKSHAKTLYEAIAGKGYPTILLTGSGTPKEKRERLLEIKDVPDDQPFSIVATGNYAGEGFDDARLDTLILATPISFEGRLTQYTGRIHRDYPGKQSVTVYDYVDVNIPMLDRMYRKRLKGYASLSYQISPDTKGPMNLESVLTGSKYLSILENDLIEAISSVVIVARRINSRKIELMLATLASLTSRGVEVTVVLESTSSVQDSRSAELDRLKNNLIVLNCKVVSCESNTAEMVIIDKKIAWYGDLPFFAFARKEDVGLRIQSLETAQELLELPIFDSIRT